MGPSLAVLAAVAASPLLYVGGSGLQVLMSQERSVALAGPSCEALRAPASALLSWRRRLEPDAKAPLDCSCGGGACRVVVDQALPPFARSTLGTFAFKANCFNTALQGAGLSSETGYTRAEELKRTLEARCAPASTPSPGDVGVVGLKGPSFLPSHAFIYVTPELGYEKPDTSASYPWRFMDPSSQVGGESSPFPGRSFELRYFRCGRGV